MWKDEISLHRRQSGNPSTYVGVVNGEIVERVHREEGDIS